MKPVTLESTLGKPSREISKIKEKLRQQQQNAAKQYNSLCYDVQDDISGGLLVKDRERKQSRKDLKRHNSPGKLVRSKSKHLQKCSARSETEVKRHDIGALYSELMAVKSQYKKLKGSYEKLQMEKMELTNRGLNERVQTGSQLEQAARQTQKYKKNALILEKQLQRIRKQCLKVIQTQRFKNKRLQQIIQQKDLMIAYLRNELDKNKKGNESAWSTVNQSSFAYYQNVSQLNYAPNSINCSNISNIVIDQHNKPSRGGEDDSLCFSRDHSKEMDSINSLLTNNDFYHAKKDIVIVEPKPADPFTEPSQCLTFEQRYEEPLQLKQPLKMPPRQAKKDSSRSKNPKSTKRLKLATHGDENTDTNSRLGDNLQQKMVLTCGFSKQRKKASSSSRKKI